MENLEQLKEKYKLTQKEHEKLLKQIELASLKNKKTCSNPKVLFVIGQPGSGKSTLIQSNKEYNSLILVNSDNYRAMFSTSGEILSKYPTYYAALTNYDAHKLGDELTSIAVSKGYSVVREKAPINVSDFMSQIMKYKKTEVHVMATGNLNSALSTRERYEKEFVQSVNAKLTDLNKHNQSYIAIREIVNECEKQGIKVVVYSCATLKPVSLNNKTAYQLLIELQEQDNQFTKPVFSNRLEKIKKTMMVRKAPKEQFNQLKEIEKLIDPSF